jgi:RNA polymerase sigma-70 factor (ECF subfamily)
MAPFFALQFTLAFTGRAVHAVSSLQISFNHSVSLFDQHLCGRAGLKTFASTHWSVVLRAGGEQSRESAAALDKLCHTYWYPLYAFVRREGYDPDAAQDLTQEFFGRLLTNHALDSVDRSKGKFRSFLLSSMKHLLANEWNRSQRQKRGGGSPHFSLDAANAEGRYQLDPVDELTPEKVFERRWAETLIDSVTRRLREEFEQTGALKRFEELKVFLLAGDEPASYAETAGRLSISEGAVRTAIYRMRQRYGELFREEIAQTVADLPEMEEEIRHFLKVLGG